METMILASKSPRRKEILEMLAWNFEVCSQETEEIFEKGKSIEENMQKIALEKAKAVVNLHPNSLILSCDTMVVVENTILGKPKNKKEAKAMLQALSGKHSYVYSAVALLDRKRDLEETFVEKTKIYFYQMSEKEIDDYIATGEPMDKAGAYAIQGKASVFIEKIEGDYWNVVGLPISRVYQKLKEWGYL
ncbi:Maf family protein [Fusobacterium gonidiaformans]|uniref:Maf family protein n=1 Tax=Fusobacterium gonidiaformans TaxID=849 RepID=UPI0001BC65B3|nr:Maf family protein [Fusobacterium gonidiaformans]AVQ16079.1 septum formation inhibitor Maf [Fusobacterium gonidiaformans ATCC 25563]EFS28698.1 septum formation protein Maf [Fusobacterium gonidiaformans ATCC 25563]